MKTGKPKGQGCLECRYLQEPVEEGSPCFTCYKPYGKNWEPR